MHDADAAPRAARKRFGQHFLVDPLVVDAIVDLVRPCAGDRILEIGPGGGVLTGALVRSGAELVAVEIDRDLAARLAARYDEATNFALHNDDILKFDFTRLDAGDGPWKVVGNLPYNISTPLIMRLLGEAGRFSTMILMLQREVAERLAAAPGSKAYGRLSVMAQRRASVSLCIDVGPECFSPPPKVHSAVVEVRPRAGPFDPALEHVLEDLVRAAFGARRKTIANALHRLVDRARLAQCGIDPGARAEDLGVDDFVRLATVCHAGTTS